MSLVSLLGAVVAIKPWKTLLQDSQDALRPEATGDDVFQNLYFGSKKHTWMLC